MVCENFTDCPYESFRQPCQVPECERFQPMPTNAQIEAVARAINPDAWGDRYPDYILTSMQQMASRAARDAIAAYEATRPAVVTDIVIPELPWWVWKVIFIAQGEHWDCLLVRWISTTESRSIVGRGPMPEDALAAALAEAGKESSDG